jgi:hypothetical protein
MRPHIVGIGKPEITIKAMLERKKFLVMSQVPFAYGAGLVALGFEHLGEQDFVIVDTVFSGRPKCSMDSDAIGIATGKQACSGS